MENLDKAKKKRKSHRGTTTKLLNKLDDALKEENVNELRLRQIQTDLKEKAECLKELDEQIFDLMIELLSEDDCDKEADEASEIKERITYGLILLEDALKEDVRSAGSVVSGSQQGQILQGSQQLSRSASRESLNSVASSNISAQICGRKVKLPKLELRKFSGKIAEWPEFWDGFRSAVHDDEQLAKVDKFKYLRSYLEEPARSVVAGFPLTDADYDSAIEMLKDRFAKPSVIKRVHLNDLALLPPVYNEKNVQGLRNFHDQIETRFRALEAQGVDKETYSSVVVPALMSKIPSSVRNNMIRFGANHMEWNLDDLIAALKKELDVLEGHFPMLQLEKGGWKKSDYEPNRPKQHQQAATASALFAGKDSPRKCVYCLENHLSESCEKVKDPGERKNVLTKFARCFCCLKTGHRFFKCRSKVECKICSKGNHHCSICPSLYPPKETQPKHSAPTLDPNATAWTGTTGSEGKVALQTALAVVNGKKGSRMRVLFDSGSHRSFITAKAVSKLDLRPVRRESLGIKAFGSSEEESADRDVVNFSLGPLNGSKHVKMEAFVVNDIASIPNIHVEVVKETFLHLTSVWFSDVCRNDDFLEIDCLIGSDWLWSFQEEETIRGGPQEPVAVKTSLGWVLSGPLQGEKIPSSYDCHVNVCVDPMSSLNKVEKQEIDSNLQKLWDLDSIGIREEDKVHESVLDDIAFTGSRYSVGLPWKLGHKPLPSNYNVCLLRLKSQVKKLEQTPDIFDKYNDIISQQVSEGIIEQVSELEPASKIHYLPHRAVIRENAETTKVRIVYDASCKDRKSGVSLNECLHVGPSLTPLIFDVLLRFRMNPVALVGDIEKAFLNIEIHPQDRDCLRFLWLKDIHAKDPEVIVYRFLRVLFGYNASPFLLNCVLRHHIRRYEQEDPEFVNTLIGGFFVDDLVTACADPQEALTLYEKAKRRMKEGGFTLRKWKTNDGELAKEIAQRESEKKEPKTTGDPSYAQETLGAPSTADGKGKVLGIPWDNKRDTLEFDLGQVSKEIGKTSQPTKRGILSTLASLFDPHGLVSPVAVLAKILFQELCLEKLGWDDPLPEDKHVRWETWLKDLKCTNTISVTRCVFAECKGKVLSCQLHGFADASKKAYCAMVFLVCKTTEGTYTRLLSAKTRVAPLKQLTIPRLELMSARVLATLMSTILEALGPNFKVDEVKYWLDSKTALFWIYNNGEWKQFVQHRVNEILRLTRKEDWGHVSGIENPADLGSRGVPASHLKDSKLWWKGPNWLQKGKESWPNWLPLEDSPDVSSEKRKSAQVMLITKNEEKKVSNVVNLERHGSLARLLRVTAYVMRFVSNLKKKRDGMQRNVRRLSVEEIEIAERLWIEDVQQSLKKREDFEKISVQLGVVNEDGMMVCRGRLGNSDLDFRSKYPILLPKSHPFTDLVINDCHKRVLHNKLRSTLAELRARFWVPQGRQQVKRVIGKCHICRRLEGKAYKSPPEAELPNFRVNETLPFSNTGVDFAGPLFVKNGPGEMKKVYVALFTCCVTRAIHLELVEDLNTISFVNCLRRFCSRRGTPRLINSDNAKTFKAADKLLDKLATDHTFLEFLDHRRILWKFNLPLSPWWGGYWERMVGCVKRCLRKVLGNARLTRDELTTVFTEVESTLNSRPLTYLYDELGEVLTPSHLLYGHRLSHLSEGINPEIDANDDVDNLSRRFLYLTKKLSHFWNRWRKEYLTDLREFHKMQCRKAVPIEIGDLVLLQEDSTKRGQWKTAVVENLINGKDGEIRGAVVRKAGKGKPETLIRPLQKLFPLEISARDHLKTDGNEECITKERVESKIDGEKIGLENDCGTRSHMGRAAAKDARWKSKLMLDP